MAARTQFSASLSAREVVAAGRPFRQRGEPISDPGVALDEVMSLEAAQEPVVLRVRVTSGSPRDRASLDADWLCEPGAGPPSRLASPPSPTGHGGRRASSRRLIDVWESCSDASWMVEALCRNDRIDARLPVAAACACVRRALGLSPWAGAGAPAAALAGAESWLLGSSDPRALASLVAGAVRWVREDADGEAETAAGYAAADAAAAALHAGGGDYTWNGADAGLYGGPGHRLSAAAAVKEATTCAAFSAVGRRASAYMADVVRSAVPAIDVLRGWAG